MSKEDADTEVRLSGLLAPNAPSHRSLWSPKDAKARRAGKHKYKLNDEDDQKWDLWKRKVGSGDAGTSPSDAKEKDTKSNARSTPMAVAPPTQFIAAGSGIGPRPLREATMIDPDYSSSINTFSAFDRHVQARAAATAASDQAAATVAGGVSIGKRTWGYGSFKDDTSGFETEPKTSLPYKEKMMVPSLRKALRKSIYEPEPHVKLATIPDTDDAATSVSGGGSVARSAVSAQPAGRDIQSQNVAATTSPALKDADLRGALPGSVISRGFHMPGATSQSELVKPIAVAAASAPVNPIAATGLGIPSVATSGKSAVVRSELATRDAAVGPSLPGSGAATPSSFGRRSPRPPYVAPPPPTSATTVLVSDPAQHPRPLQLFKSPADPTFLLHEDGEEAETPEGWRAILKFMHIIEQLKTNKRTGWLHHRIPAPESIADHMYRMAMLSLLCPAEADVDLGKCVQLAIVHDLAEAEVGDLTPLDGVGKEEKMRREKEAIQYFVHDLLGSSAAGLRIEALWEEYEARETKESKLVKDLDRFELSLQAIEYERRYGIDDLQAFWEGSIPHVGHPRIRRWAQELAKERAEMWGERGRGYVQPEEEAK
uniref:5'-deoxynucleotidase n=2 Tax=Kalmanozyma brasiliensis (strain GHG001) TaxID=1365824 RepID=V5GVZ1_KALBG